MVTGRALCAGVYYGTILHRIDATVLRFMPGFIKNPLKKVIGKVISFGRQGFNATAGRLTDTLVNRCAPSVCDLAAQLLQLHLVCPDTVPTAGCPRAQGEHLLRRWMQNHTERSS